MRYSALAAAGGDGASTFTACRVIDILIVGDIFNFPRRRLRYLFAIWGATHRSAAAASSRRLF
jgi:hypothetical protein